MQEIYTITNIGCFAKDFELRSQMRRAAISVLSNIAEGFGRYHKKEFIRFLDIAHGSPVELQSQLYIALDLKYLDTQRFSEINKLLIDTQRTILGLLRYLRNSDASKKKVQDPEISYSRELADTYSIELPAELTKFKSEEEI